MTLKKSLSLKNNLKFNIHTSHLACLEQTPRGLSQKRLSDSATEL